MKKIFYTTEVLDQQATNNLEKYNNHIDIIAPQCYRLQDDGSILGEPDDKLVKIASQYKIPIMPLIVNQGFNQESFHQFLYDQDKQQAVINTMLALCKKNNYYGIQFDFENISAKDKDQYTAFYKATAERFHQENLKISIAIVPRLYDNYDDKSPYQQWYFDNWIGAYDQKELAKVSDFVSLMSYDHHSRYTPPGPIAGLPWVKQLLSISLQSIPPEKISLGIPFYSGYWTTDMANDKPVVVRKGLGYDKVEELIERAQVNLKWDDEQKVHYAVIKKEFNNNYLFVEDASSLEQKLNLITENKLHGFSAWRIGFEDEKFYDLLGDIDVST